MCEINCTSTSINYNKPSTANVPVYNGISVDRFKEEICSKREPCVLRGLDIGSCPDLWTPDYLTSHAPPGKHVQIHVSTQPKLDFIHKNFAYKTLPFDEFIHRCSRTGELEEFFFDKNECYYLRCLGDDVRKDVARIDRQFPGLSDDINIPPLFEPEQLFSSVLRVASPGTQLWTHYDIMDNMLIQVTGHKHAVLFSPQHQNSLYMKGDKSEVLDIDSPDVEKYPKFLDVPQHHCHLQPGDVLFIPALWFHNIRSLDFTVSVNVFWRHLAERHYDKSDVYGNNDLLEATRGQELVRRACKLLDALPRDYRNFYYNRIIGEMVSRLHQS